MSEERRSVLPVVIGIALTALLLLLLAYITSQRNAEIAAQPKLTLITPLANDAVDAPLIVVFSSARPLELKSTGWGAGTLHLHAWVNGVQYMPAAGDIRARPDGTYQWTLANAPRGPNQELYLAWADALHRAVAGGSTTPIPITIN